MTTLSWNPVAGASAQVLSVDGQVLNLGPAVASLTIDAVMPPPAAPAPPAGTILADGSFEALDSKGYVYRPTGSAWTFSGNSGLQRNNSDWGAPVCPDGVQSAFLQSGGGDPKMPGVITQTFSIAAAGDYVVRFSAARRAYLTGNALQQIRISVDGVQLAIITPSSASSWDLELVPVTLSAGKHTLAFAATIYANDTSAFIDNVAIVPAQSVPVTSPAPAPAPAPTYPPAPSSFVYDGRSVTNADGSVELWARNPQDIGAIRVPDPSELEGTAQVPDYLQSIQDLGLADCWIKGTLTALAYARPGSIAAIVVYEGPNNVRVTFARGGVITHVHTTDELPAGTAGRETWSAFVEKASIAFYGFTAYNQLNFGNAPLYLGLFVSHVSGTFFYGTSDAALHAAIQGAKAAGNPIIVATDGQATHIVPSHLYAVLDSQQRGDGYYVQLRNPWGIDGPDGDSVNDGLLWVPFAHLRSDASQIVYGVA